jgi:hypothetical protein
MNALKLILHQNKTHFRPGDEIRGTAGWIVDRVPQQAEVHLFWSTRGKGTTDTRIIDTESFSSPRQDDSRTFSFRLSLGPTAPYSFSGTLISLVWAVELIVTGSKPFRIELTVSPWDAEIDLSQPEPLATNS